MEQDPWPDTRSLLECGTLCPPESQTGTGSVRILGQSAASLRLAVSASAPRWLIVRINRLPGWIVNLDGTRVETVFANGTFFGIRVPAGTHEISMRYTLGELLMSEIRRMF
jgi:hypothetical protein